MSARVLVTGASGFVGSAVCDQLAASGYRVRAALRSDRALPESVPEKSVVGEIDSKTDWSAALAGVDYVIHAAARVHVMRDTPASADLYAETNTHGTARLAEAAAAAGVRRLLFLSSVKVNGEESSGRPYSAADKAHPQDPYGASKWMAEQRIQEIAGRSGLQFAIVRPPLVYGPGVRANFLRLLEAVDRERWLPLGAIGNRRSLVSVWNLSDLLVNLLANPAGAGKTWMVSDDDDLSTPELVRRMAVLMRRRARLLPIPVAVLRALGHVTGKSAEISRLCGSLTVDVATTRKSLSWAPPVNVDTALGKTVEWYLAKSGRHER